MYRGHVLFKNKNRLGWKLERKMLAVGKKFYPLKFCSILFNLFVVQFLFDVEP